MFKFDDELIAVWILYIFTFSMYLLRFFGEGIDFNVELAFEGPEGYFKLFDLFPKLLQSTFSIDLLFDGRIHILPLSLLFVL